jgi:hypothetical protein
MKRENVTAEKNKDEDTTEDAEEHGVFGNKSPFSLRGTPGPPRLISLCLVFTRY